MQHFEFLPADARERLFHLPPAPFDRESDPALLAVALGAALYAPATRTSLAADAVRMASLGVRSMVVCLEDAVADDDVPAAQAHAVAELAALSGSGAAAPLLFVRVRRPEQVLEIASSLGPAAGVLAGFVLPKFTEDSGGALEAVEEASALAGTRLLAMPVLESPVIAARETRVDALVGVGRLLDKHRDSVLSLRIGATDLSSAYALRRDRDLTVYDVAPVAAAIADIVGVLGRADGSGFTISGPVWEYFSARPRMFRSLLRSTPFEEQDAGELRDELVTRDVDGLLREVVLDKASGLTGKTVIHPSHVLPVHALSVVTHEEWSDASDILGTSEQGGVAASHYRNKMNESKPHTSWARRTLRRAEAFGVYAEGVSYVDLLAAAAA
ncbi:citrate lyase beta subunit [Motilibacter rhizosphaerae]|uniref:Citrate lyase beta subunit n=1 Tax=Motilibacter rhizosphaerae TaxID=598652 RepID=A0A4Q7NUI7_9ACTN|nr:HpcH/HpaI aldolase/citrate lyase family protein [Motilibacter rhizosphaerae]RZS90092.1 citrate lyase beta subunit [Motilibacter rhizosphaerae]